MSSLYLIPVTLGDTSHDRVLPAYNAEIVRGIRHFIVEEIRTARRFLKAVDRNIDIDSLTFYEMGKHADRSRFSEYLNPLRKGEDVGVISEAGCPAVADPGADPCGDCPTRRTESCTPRGAFQHPLSCDGIRLQWTEFCVSRLSPH